AGPSDDGPADHPTGTPAAEAQDAGPRTADETREPRTAGIAGIGAATGIGALAAAAVGGIRTPRPAEPEPPAVGFPGADPDLLFDNPPPREPAPAPEAAPAGPDRRDPGRLAAEQAAADLALLRTFGAADLASRPDRAPDIALESPARPEPEPQAGAAQPVRFRVVRHTGEPIADVAVALLDDHGRETATGRSDAAGAGTLQAPRPGSFVLVATAAEHQPGAVALTVGDAPADAVLVLVRSAVLTGTVTGEDGPVAGARVTLVQDGEVVEATNTAADGTFRLADLAGGEYAVSVAAAGCEPDVDLVTVRDEAEAVHDVELAPAGVAAG
ncbi:MAG: carboxypeptidase-like regulatory domain-containing protein, partial [Pseudonocardiales bacterium]|nr:carboxypeptidase-like regulatory domain-containing protein [Pseudonocardiales bacterium]